MSKLVIWGSGWGRGFRRGPDARIIISIIIIIIAIIIIIIIVILITILIYYYYYCYLLCSLLLLFRRDPGGLQPADGIDTVGFHNEIPAYKIVTMLINITS